MRDGSWHKRAGSHYYMLTLDQLEIGRSYIYQGKKIIK